MSEFLQAGALLLFSDQLSWLGRSTVMSNEWFLSDGNAKHGPLAQAELTDRLKAFKTLENVSVWRSGFQDWKPVEQVSELSQTAGLVAPFATPTISYTRRYGLYGVYAGLAVGLAELGLHGRLENFASWQGEGLAYYLGYFVGTVVILWFVGFAIGLFRDAQRSAEPGKAVSSSVDATQDGSQSALPNKPGRDNNFIARNWRGEYSLVTSYWVFGFLGNILVGLVGALVITAAQSRGYDPRQIMATTVMIWVTILAIVTWQSVGVWRSANRYMAARVMVGKRSPWAAVAKVAIIIGMLRLLGTFAVSGIPQLAETSRMALLDDPDIPAYSIRVMRSGSEAEITGGFKYGLTDDFAKILQASPQLRVVHLDSLGGRIGEAVKLNALIRNHNLDTYVPAECLSACTLAFAGGQRRILRRGAKLGFHAATFPGMSASELAEASTDQRDIFTAAGFEKSFVDRALSTSNSDMWEPVPDVLIQAGAITAVSDGSEFAISGFGPNPSKDHLGEILARWLPVLQPLKVRVPVDYDAVVQAFHDSFSRGDPEQQAISAARSKLATAIMALRPLADDAVLVDIANIYADEYSKLGARNATLCYQYASGVGNGLGPADIPVELVRRENEISKRVVETATKRPVTPDSVSRVLWNKIGPRLAAKGLTAEQFDLIGNSSVPARRHAEYCNAIVLLYREIGKLPQNEAAILLRELFAAR